MKKILALSAVLAFALGASSFAHGEEVGDLVNDPAMATEAQTTLQASMDPQNDTIIAPSNTTSNCCGLGQFTSPTALLDNTVPRAGDSAATRDGSANH